MWSSKKFVENDRGYSGNSGNCAQLSCVWELCAPLMYLGDYAQLSCIWGTVRTSHVSGELCTSLMYLGNCAHLSCIWRTVHTSRVSGNCAQLSRIWGTVQNIQGTMQNTQVCCECPSFVLSRCLSHETEIIGLGQKTIKVR